ncbi:amidohydrolase family protein [Streptomyces sp. NPDC002564]|uniref:metal-dependent hydrolase family protein n=1 Tax=Streptomyces sp. NPDC002564 TaxID=3364649 RepID=UPI0036A4014F
MSDTVLLTAPHWWDGHRLRPHARVLVRDGRITDTDCRRPPPGTTHTDLGGHTLLPGLIDCHVHLAQPPPTTAPDTTTSRALAALPALRDLLANGFTTVRDLGATLDDPPTIHLRHALATGIITGPRLLLAPHMISPRNGHADHSTYAAPPGTREHGALADGTDEILRQIRLEARLGADWIKCAATGGITSPTDRPDLPAYTQDELDTLVRAATDLGLPCATHAFSDDGIIRAVRAGVRSVEHACLATPATLELLRTHGVFLVPTLYAVTYHLDRLDDEAFWAGRPREHAKLTRYAEALRGHGSRIAAGNTKLAFGTDAGLFPHSENWREFPALTTAGLAPHQALRAATSTAAELLRCPDLGTIAPGSRADLIAVPGNPLHDIDVMGAVDFVMQHGAVRRCPHPFGDNCPCGRP